MNSNMYSSVCLCVCLCARCDSELSEVRCSRLLCCLDEFIRHRCRHTSLTVSSCLQSVDRQLLSSGWQEISLINDTTTIFVYSLLSHSLHDDSTTSLDELRTLGYDVHPGTASYVHWCTSVCTWRTRTSAARSATLWDRSLEAALHVTTRLCWRKITTTTTTMTTSRLTRTMRMMTMMMKI